MGAVGALIGAIASAIATAAVAVATVIASVISAVVTAISAVAGAIYAGVSATISAVVSSISAVASSITGAISSAVGGISATLSSWAGTVWSYGQHLYGVMQGFAKVIHLKTIMKVHKIAYLISSDYRGMINQIFYQFSKLSEALGLGAQFIGLALQNARNLVLDVSAMMGKSYDLAQITWLKSLSSFTKEFQKNTKKYENNPGVVFQDIERWILKDSVNAGSAVQRTVFTTLKNATEIIGVTVDKVVTVRDDLEKLISDLPKGVRDEIESYVNPVIDSMDEFLKDEYKPFEKKLNAITAVLDNKQTITKNKVDGIVEKLTKPGDVLLSVDKLPVGERIDQEDKISDVSGRANERQAGSLKTEAKTTWEALEKLKKALEEAPPKPGYIIPEPKKLIVPVGQQSKKADTWYVGDY